MGVSERKREIGVMLAMGLMPRSVVALVLIENVILTALAALVGGAVAFGFVWYWSGHAWDFSGLISGMSMRGFTMSPLVYPALDAVHTAGVFVVLALISCLSALWPALRASRFNPAEVIGT